MKIILIGFMGTGKSTIGRKLAAELGLSFYDVDREIEKVTGMKLIALYKKEGRIRFRSEEKLMLGKLLEKEDVVIATGGTLEVNEGMLEEWRAKGFTVIALWLRCEDIYKRVKKRTNRPMLERENMYETIDTTCISRKEIYQKADLFLNTTDLNFEEIIKKIVMYLA